LNICVNATKQIPSIINNIQTNDEFNINALYNAVCDVMEAVLDIFGSSTSNIIDGLVKMALEILKNSKCEAAARILKKMVSTFSKQLNLANNFIKLIKDAIIYFNNIEEIGLCHKAITQIFEYIGSMDPSHPKLYLFVIDDVDKDSTS